MGPLSQLPRVALTCSSGPGTWVELGPQVMVLGCGSTSVICLASSLPTTCPWASPTLPLGASVFLDREVSVPSCEGQSSPGIIWEPAVVVHVSLGRTVLVLLSVTVLKHCPNMSWVGKGLCVLNLHIQLMAEGSQGKN